MLCGRIDRGIGSFVFEIVNIVVEWTMGERIRLACLKKAGFILGMV